MAKSKEEKQEKELTKAEKIALQKKELEKKYGVGTLIAGDIVTGKQIGRAHV